MSLSVAFFGIVASISALWAAWLSLARPLVIDWQAWWKILLDLRIESQSKTDSSVVHSLNQLLISPDFEPSEMLFSGLSDSNREAVSNLEKDEVFRYFVENADLLGKDYRLSHALSITDQTVFEAAAKEFVHRGLSHCCVVGLNSDWAQQLSALWNVPATEGRLELEFLGTFLGHASKRLVFVAQGHVCQELLEFMHAHPGLRDAVAAVLLVHPVLNEAWVAEHFTHEQFDVEANQALPYFLWHLPEQAHLSFALSTPPIPATGWRSIEVIDLGGLTNSAMDCPNILLPCVSIVVTKRITA